MHVSLHIQTLHGSLQMSNEGKEEVIKQDQAAKSERDIHSVPFFVVNDHYTFSGAQVKFCFCTFLWFKHFVDILPLWDSVFKLLCAICLEQDVATIMKILQKATRS